MNALKVIISFLEALFEFFSGGAKHSARPDSPFPKDAGVDESGSGHKSKEDLPMPPSPSTPPAPTSKSTPTPKAETGASPLDPRDILGPDKPQKTLPTLQDRLKGRHPKAGAFDCFKFTAEHEGAAWSGDPKDNGNWSGGRQGKGNLAGSKYGISAPVASKLLGRDVTAAEMKKATPLDFAYVAFPYWQNVGAHDLPYGVDLMCFDFGYNSGEKRAVKLLQGIVGAPQDGYPGPNTTACVQKWLKANQDLDTSSTKTSGVTDAGLWDVLNQDKNAIAYQEAGAVAGLITRLAQAQLDKYKSYDQWGRYGKGWSRRLYERLAKALELARAYQGTPIGPQDITELPLLAEQSQPNGQIAPQA